MRAARMTTLAAGGAALMTMAFAGAAGAGPAEDKGLEIARKADKANDGFKGEVSTMEMIPINAHGERTTRKLTSRGIETTGDGDRSRIEFEWPADVKGTRMLTWTHRQSRRRPVAVPAGGQSRQAHQLEQQVRVVHGQRVRVRRPGQPGAREVQATSSGRRAVRGPADVEARTHPRRRAQRLQPADPATTRST